MIRKDFIYFNEIERGGGNTIRWKGSYNKDNEIVDFQSTDGYDTIPTYEQLCKKRCSGIDPSRRTIGDLEVINSNAQIADNIHAILKKMDEIGMKNQNGYKILTQVIALKIYDEKNTKSCLSLYIDKKEQECINLSDAINISFTNRIEGLYKTASEKYRLILDRNAQGTILWNDENHILLIKEVIKQFQNYGFTKSVESDLYQMVFYEFANAFSKVEGGQFLTPIPIIKFLVEIVNPRGGETIIDPTSGVADFLSFSFVNSRSRQPLSDENIYGLDTDDQMVMLAQLNMLLNGDGNAKLKRLTKPGSISWKFDNYDDLVQLNPGLHKEGNWDNWKDKTQLKKFDVVLTNPPFGENRAFKPETDDAKKLIECYELWESNSKQINKGVIFLENAYRILKDNGRMGIILSNSIASTDGYLNVRKWLMNKMRIVALFDLPPNAFLESGVNTSIIVAYKANEKELNSLKKSNYQVFLKTIDKVGYKVKKIKRIARFSPEYKIDYETFELVIDEQGRKVKDEEFTETVRNFKEWCKGQEETLQNLFIKEK